MFRKDTSQIDYSKSDDKRKLLSNYVRTGNFSRYSPAEVVGECVARRRTVLFIIALAVIGTGLYFVFF